MITVAHANVTPEEVLRIILNKVSDEENDIIEDIASLASDDEIDVALSTSFISDNPEDVNGADQTVTGNQDNASIGAGTTQRRQLTQDRLIHDLESALDEHIHIPLSLRTTEKTFTSYLENPKPPNNLGVQMIKCLFKPRLSDTVKYFNQITSFFRQFIIQI